VDKQEYNPIQKSKRDDCSNYRGVSLLNSGYKIYATIITQRFKTIPEAILLEEQNGFRIGRSCIDNVQGGSNMTGTDLCVNLATLVPVIFEPPCIYH